MTSVMLQASSMEEYTGLWASQGKGKTTPQTRRKRLSTCIRVVKKGDRTMPVEGHRLEAVS